MAEQFQLTERDGVGGNQPQMTEMARETAADLNDWLKDHPAIGSADEAREARPRIDRAKMALADLDDERKAKVAPLNTQVAAINDSYRAPRSSLETILGELNKRLSAYMAAETVRREAEAAEARRQAQEAEDKARAAEAAEKEALANAEAGELDIDILAETEKADTAFSEYKKAERIAQRAERDTKVRVGGGLTGRAIGLRNHETLVVTNWMTAVVEMGLTEEIATAIAKSARAYRKLRGRLPDGVDAMVGQSL